ncbi:hypothetical protein E2C01_071237 [Portunus trituberculatus]|uniref:Uncharacterized protein n=1 Tax=Portunus trituberculatus TaxID=210409 RepID=A0A5B7I498_PORTR|nr:hypothetical protein [Portunus trituberculatus]
MRFSATFMISASRLMDALWPRGLVARTLRVTPMPASRPRTTNSGARLRGGRGEKGRVSKVKLNLSLKQHHRQV